MTHHPDSRLSPTAMLALVVGIFSAVCFFVFMGIAGLAAVVLGFVALNEIKRSEGRLHGDGVAIAGIVLGVLHLGGLVIGLALYITAHAGSKSTRGAPPIALPAPAPAPPAPPSAPKLVNPEQPGGRTPDAATRATRFGEVTLVDPGPGAGTLETLLREERGRADAEHARFLVWISSPEFPSCNGVSVALRDSRMQKALGAVRILRLNVNDYYVELSRQGLPVKVLPGFALMSPEGRPLDYVNGGEWDADVPENIAPVLGNFIHGRYTRRRNPWRGPQRDDETQL
ncbi:MAG TPA: DUF4190 domain-containing protein [Polyangiaceae bacterium]